MKLWTLILASALAFTSLHADASKRLGGGKSMGQQSSNVTQREAVKPAPAATPAPSTAPAMAQPKKSWGMGGMLGGLAAGLGLAWLVLGI